MGKDTEKSHIDTQFLADLSDIRNIGRYEIIRKLGRGSTGLVYLGRDPYIHRNVSIKISRPASNLTGKKADRYREKFFVEAQSAGKLVHPGIVAIFDAGMHKDFCYIAMEYIDGPALEKYCSRDNLLPLNKVVEILFMACKALDYAHKQGVIHRDIKPSNIMLTKALDVKITDFSIAKIMSEDTTSKGIIGSPSYMSPEQIKEDPIDERSDIFSMGCVLYELLTGEKAFYGDNSFSILYKITHEDPPRLREIRPDVPEILVKIAGKALEKDPRHRYQSSADLAYDLRIALRGLGGHSKDEKAEDLVEYVHNVPFFDNFTREQVKDIMNASSILKIPNGKVIVAEGEIDDTFYIILSGRVAVQKNEKNIALIRRGECFGEMSYLSGQSRAATVAADTDCVLLKISGTLLDQSSEHIQVVFLKKFAKTLVHRLAKSN